MTTSKEKSETRRLPMMPIRDVVIFPHMMTPFVVGRESSVRALEEALAGDKKIFLATQHDASIDEPRPDEIFSVGTVANIVQSLKQSDGNVKVLVEGVERGKILSVSEDEGYFRATVKTFNFKIEAGAQLDALTSRVTGLFEQYAKLSQNASMKPSLSSSGIGRGESGAPSRPRAVASFTNASQPPRGIHDPMIALEMARDVGEVAAILGESPGPDREAIKNKTHTLNEATQHLAEVMMNRSVHAALSGKSIGDL